jgi:hypothetical protein
MAAILLQLCHLYNWAQLFLLLLNNTSTTCGATSMLATKTSTLQLMQLIYVSSMIKRGRIGSNSSINKSFATTHFTIAKDTMLQENNK